MFDLPLLLPGGTQYDDLGVSPDASVDGIRDAKAEAIQRIDKERTEVERELAEIRKVVPGLVEAQRKLREAKQNGEEIPASLRREVAVLEAKASAANPRFSSLERRLLELEHQKIDINKINLENPELRRAYDEMHPPLALIKLANAATDSFAESASALFLLRREITRFLAGKQEQVYHTSDLTRQEFTDDFTFNPLLDRV